MERLVKSVGVLLLALILIGCRFSTQAPVAPTPPTFTIEAEYGQVIGQAAEMLAKDWDTTNVMQKERGYCIVSAQRIISVRRAEPKATIVMLITEVERAKVDTATPWSATFICQDSVGHYLADVHTHPPTTCNRATLTCVWSDSLEIRRACQASDPDRFRRKYYGLPFAVVQCGRSEFRFYK